MHLNIKVFILFSAILVLIYHLGSAQAPATNSKQAGTCAGLDIIVISKGKPIDKASVFVQTKGGDEFEGRTNKEGVASMKEVPYGRTLVQAITKSGTIIGGYYELKEGNCRVQIELEPKPEDGKKGEKGP